MPISISRRTFLALTGGVGVSSLSACDDTRTKPRQSAESLRYDGPSLTLSYWNGFTGPDSATMAALVTEFNASQADITVVTRTYPWLAYYPNLHVLTDRRLGPDVGVMQADHLPTEAAAGLIAPLEGTVHALDLRADDFLPTPWRLGTYQGVRYGIPLDVHCLALFCNREHLTKAGIGPPTDAATFEEACRRLRDAGYPHPCWITNTYPALQIFLGLLWQNGGNPYSSDLSRATFATDEAMTALMWMVDQGNKGYSPSPVLRDAHWNEFIGAGHENTLELNGIWQIPAADASGLDYDVAPVPKIGPHAAQWANSHQMFVSRRTAKDKHRLRASQVFLDFLSRQSSAWAAAGMIPARGTQRELGLYTSSRQYVLDPNLESMRFLPELPGLPTLTSATLGDAVRRSVHDQLSSRDAQALLERAASRADPVLQHAAAGGTASDPELIAAALVPQRIDEA